jgi:PAS domain S-box-containing protein
MSKKSMDAIRQAELRSKAVSQLGGHRESEAASRSAPPAYEVLHKLASSPSTAVDALALLHELQVHQVELELQAEEMRGAYTELEALLHRQRQLYEAAPVGCFTVDGDAALVELNSPGAQLLGSERDQLLGHALHGFLTPDSARRLQAHIGCVGAGRQVDTCTLQLLLRDGKSHSVHATVSADPAGSNFLVAFMSAGAH